MDGLGILTESLQMMMYKWPVQTEKKYVQPSAIKDINENTEAMRWMSIQNPSNPVTMNTSNARWQQREEDSLAGSMFTAGGKSKPAIKEMSMKLPAPIRNRFST